MATSLRPEVVHEMYIVTAVTCKPLGNEIGAAPTALR